MKDEAKNKRQLIQELFELRKEIVALEKARDGRREIEEALRESGKRYKAMVESATDFIHTTNIQGNFTFANASALKVTGTSLEEFKRLNYLQIIHPDHRQRLAEIYLKQFQERKPTIYVEFPIISGSGEVVWLGQNSSLFFEGEKVAGFYSVARDITELKRAEEKLRRSEEQAKRLAQENALVAEIGRIIGSTPNIDEVFERFSKEVAKFIAFDRIVVNLCDAQKGTSLLRYVSGIDVPKRRAGEYVFLAGTATAECARTRASLLIQPKDEKGIQEEVGQFPGLLRTFEVGLRSIIMVPLITEDQIIGVLSLRSVKTKAYTDQDVRLTESIASQIAGAIANAQLFTEREQAEEALRKSEEAAQQLAKENEIIAEIGMIISSTFIIEEVYEVFAEKARELVPFDRIVVNLNDLERDTITQLYVSGMGIAERGIRDTFHFKGSTNEEVMRTRSGLMILAETAQEIERRFPALLNYFRSGIRSFLTVPLFYRSVVIGALHFRTKRSQAYTERHLKLAERIGGQISGMIANAQLFIELKRTEEAREKLIRELQEALANIKILRGMLPICSSCKKIRDDKGYWNQIESYIRDHTEAEFTHGICPECMKKLYPDLYGQDRSAGMAKGKGTP